MYHISRFNENRFVTSSQDQTIKIWDAEELRIITTLEVNDYITVMEVVPTKFLLAAIGHNSDYFFAWDASENFAGKECDLVLHEYTDAPITSIVHLKHHGKDDQEIVAVSDAKGEVEIWNMGELELEYKAQVHEKGEIKCLVEIQKGKNKGCVVTGGDDFTFKLVRLNVYGHSFNVLQSFTTSGPVNCIVEMSENRVCIAKKNTSQIWDLTKPKKAIKEATHHSDQIARMIPLDNGEFIFSVGRDQKIILWNTIDTEAVFEK